MALLRSTELPKGGIIPEGGNSQSYNTGNWRTYRPVLVMDRCIHCLQCWIICPDSSIMVKDGKLTGFDYDHCKGCGMCKVECPEKCHAIEMVLEKEVNK